MEQSFQRLPAIHFPRFDNVLSGWSSEGIAEVFRAAHEAFERSERGRIYKALQASLRTEDEDEFIYWMKELKLEWHVLRLQPIAEDVQETRVALYKVGIEDDRWERSTELRNSFVLP